MATFNVAKGRINELVNRVVNNDPGTSGLIIVLLKAAEADLTLRRRATLADVLAEAGNTEADFTNYARIVYTDTNLSLTTVDNVNDTRNADIPDPVWTNAGGASNNTLVKLLVCYAPDVGGADSTFEPLVEEDYAVTTDGVDLAGVIDTLGFYRSKNAV